MQLYRVAVMLTPAGGSRRHFAESYLAVGEMLAEAGRCAIETDMACNPQGVPPIGAAAKEVKGMAHTLEMNVQAIQAPELKTLARNPDWVDYEVPSSPPRP